MKILPYREDVRSIAFVGAAVAVAAAQWTGTFRHPALYAGSFGLAFLACIVNHNHQHYPTFALDGLNRCFGVLLSWAIGQPATAIVPMHNFNHHAHNNGPRDFVRASIVGFRWNLLNLLAFPFVALAGYARAKAQTLREWRQARPDLHRRLLFERLALYPVALVLLAARPLDTLTYVIAPWLAGQWLILAINHVQHVGCNPASEFAHARDITGRWVNWWCLNNGFHTAHHFRPGTHWSRLPDLHGLMRGHLDPQLQRRSLAVTLVELYVWPAKRSAALADASGRNDADAPQTERAA